MIATNQIVRLLGDPKPEPIPKISATNARKNALLQKMLDLTDFDGKTLQQMADAHGDILPCSIGEHMRKLAALGCVQISSELVATSGKNKIRRNIIKRTKKELD